jgi:DNA-binding NarL/FixJ family response regulator
VLRCVARGRSNKEIARELSISPKTVEFHRGQLMQRLDIHDVATLTRYAVTAGLV